jgi:translation elongation factor EF-Ts
VARELLDHGVSSIDAIPEGVETRIKDAIASFGENIVLRRVVQFEKTDPARSSFTSYIHLGGTVGVIAEFLLEGDGLAGNGEVQVFQKNVALQIASVWPSPWLAVALQIWKKGWVHSCSGVPPGA